MHAIDNSPEAVAQRLIDVVRALMASGQGPLLQLSDRHDLTLSQLKILMVLDGAGDPLALNELADANGLSLPATGRAVDALVRAKLVSRREDETDRRVKRVALTAKGREETGRVATARMRMLANVFAELSAAERAAFAAALAPLTARVAGRGAELAGARS